MLYNYITVMPTFWFPSDWLSCHFIYIQSKFLSENINKHQSTVCTKIILSTLYLIWKDDYIFEY